MLLVLAGRQEKEDVSPRRCAEVRELMRRGLAGRRERGLLRYGLSKKSSMTEP